MGKRVVFGLLERDHHVYTKVVESGSAEELMRHIQAKNRKGSIYYTDAFRGYQSLKPYGKHHTINHSKIFVSRRRVKNHINGIEGFWSKAKHILSHYQGVAKFHFPMYLKKSNADFITERRIWCLRPIVLFGLLAADFLYHKIGLNFDLLLLTHPRVRGESCRWLEFGSGCPPY